MEEWTSFICKFQGLSERLELSWLSEEPLFSNMRMEISPAAAPSHCLQSFVILKVTLVGQIDRSREEELEGQFTQQQWLWACERC